VLDDRTVEKLPPDGWAGAVAQAVRDWGADRVVAEANNGGEMVRSVLQAADGALPVQLVHASRSKAARAEPVAVHYANGRVRHLGRFPRLEDEMCALGAGGEYAGPGRSPDRADALVWALWALMGGAEPRVRGM
jgi:phage terminase large subunit-like protein